MATGDIDRGDMRPVDEVREQILRAVSPILPLEVPLAEAYGCVLPEPIIATEPMPAFESSAMDGFAVRAADVANASIGEPVDLHIAGRAAIGQRPDVSVGPGEAARIATGAPIPEGADTIVPIEDVEMSIADEAAGVVHILRASPPRKHLRPAGEDVRPGDLLVPAGTRLAAPELGILAAAGVAKPSVHPRPRIVILSTGDELVGPADEPGFGQVRDSNSVMLQAAIRDAGAQPFVAGIVRDDVDSLREMILASATQADAFVTSGGVSVGDRDVVKAAFRNSGEVDLYKVAMQPGMPQAFGMVEGKPFFGFPGNPVSTFVSFEVFLRPAILRMAGRRDLFRPEVVARLEETIVGPRFKTQFVRVHVRRIEGGAFVARPTGGRGSNLLATVTRANGLAVIPSGIETAPEGTKVRVMLYRSAAE